MNTSLYHNSGCVTAISITTLNRTGSLWITESGILSAMNTMCLSQARYITSSSFVIWLLTSLETVYLKHLIVSPVNNPIFIHSQLIFYHIKSTEEVLQNTRQIQMWGRNKRHLVKNGIIIRQTLNLNPLKEQIPAYGPSLLKVSGR